MPDNFVQLLDHGILRLCESMGNDLSVVRAARTSYDAAWRAGQNKGSDERLIRYLWKNKHVSPFEAVTFTWEVKAPIFVFRQWMRHKWSFNELSGRYKELPEEFYVPDADTIGVQSKDNKQARDIVENPNADKIRDIIQRSATRSFAEYRELVELNTPLELARTVLPVSTYSHMFTTCSLRSLLHFLDQRTHMHAQYEIRVFADAMCEMARSVVPVTMAVWES